MLKFYDPKGNYVAFSRDGVHITTVEAKHFGHISGDSVISPTGQLIGHIRRGHVIDQSGTIVLNVNENKN